MDFDIKTNHQRIQTMHSHTSGYHVVFIVIFSNFHYVLIHNITCYTLSLTTRKPTQCDRMWLSAYDYVVTSVIGLV